MDAAHMTENNAGAVVSGLKEPQAAAGTSRRTAQLHAAPRLRERAERPDRREMAKLPSQLPGKRCPITSRASWRRQTKDRTICIAGRTIAWHKWTENSGCPWPSLRSTQVPGPRTPLYALR